MFNKKINDEMNTQIKHELTSAYIYLAMSAQFETENLQGFAHWMRLQAQEEIGHAMKFYNFIFDRLGTVSLQAIEQPPSNFGSPLKAFEKALEHEQKITELINSLYTLADKENDPASKVFLNWFVEEQVEEEKNAAQIVETLKMIGDSKNGLFMLDHQLSKRGGE
jgi:ferritin